MKTRPDSKKRAPLDTTAPSWLRARHLDVAERGFIGGLLLGGLQTHRHSHHASSLRYGIRGVHGSDVDPDRRNKLSYPAWSLCC